MNGFFIVADFQQADGRADGAVCLAARSAAHAPLIHDQEHCSHPLIGYVSAGRLTAEQAERAGLAARVVPAAELMAEARALAGRIASASAPAVAKAKDCVLRAMEAPLAEGLRYEQCALT